MVRCYGYGGYGYGYGYILGPSPVPPIYLVMVLNSAYTGPLPRYL